LYRLIDSFLTDTPPTTALEPETGRYLLFDGTFLHRPHSIVVLMDGQTHTLLRGQFDVRENSELELRAFFEPMIGEGLRPRSFTVDGNRQVIKVLRMLWPDVVIQRCLVHIQRQGLSWCRNSPKTVHARQLPAGHRDRYSSGPGSIHKSRRRMGSSAWCSDSCPQRKGPGF
jgi:hypothetical protein